MSTSAGWHGATREVRALVTALRRKGQERAVRICGEATKPITPGLKRERTGRSVYTTFRFRRGVELLESGVAPYRVLAHMAAEADDVRDALEAYVAQRRMVGPRRPSGSHTPTGRVA